MTYQPEQMRDSGWQKDKPAYPSPYRYYIGTIGLGLACGITWTIGMTTKFMQDHVITKIHAITLLYSVATLCFIAQTWMLYRWNRRLKPSPWAKPKL